MVTWGVQTGWGWGGKAEILCSMLYTDSFFAVVKGHSFQIFNLVRSGTQTELGNSALGWDRDLLLNQILVRLCPALFSARPQLWPRKTGAHQHTF